MSEQPPAAEGAVVSILGIKFDVLGRMLAAFAVVSDRKQLSGRPESDQTLVFGGRLAGG